MPKRLLNLPSSGPLSELDLVSYGRRGRHTPLQFSTEQIEQIERTVRGVPEVMIKVSGGGKSPNAVKGHFAYIDRHGKLDVYTDDGERLQGRGVPDQLVEDWNLVASKGQYRPGFKASSSDGGPRQVYNVIFSMPARTAPQKLLAATQKFAREKFALQHRYAMVLHTDQDHPHVHLVVKAQSEGGKRLYIRKATLRQWREDFAHYLRELGVAANATPTALRGRTKDWKPDGIYRALKRGESTFMRQRAEALAAELRAGRFAYEPGDAKLSATRLKVLDDWNGTMQALRRQGYASLASDTQVYVQNMPAAATEKECLAKRLLSELATLRSQERSSQRR